MNLRAWLNGVRKSMPFAIPMIWREPKNHSTYYYFCTTIIIGFTSKLKKSIIYPNLNSAIRPIPHSDELLIPKHPTNFDFDSNIESLDEDIVFLDTDEDYVDKHTRIPHLIHQSELNDLIRDLNLTKNQAEILGSRLQEWNLLSDETRISIFRTRQKDFSCYFELQDALCYCSNIESLMNELGVQHCPEEWRLFIDSSKSSLKAVLLHNGNDYPSVPLSSYAGILGKYGFSTRSHKILQ